jgi:hypothetical protein
MNAQIAVFEKATQRLATTLGMAEEICDEIEGKDIRTAFVIRHGRNIHQLADDSLALSRCDRLGSIYLFARPALESLFKLAAAVSNKSFAAEKVVGELLEEREKLNQWKEQSDAESQAILDECIRFCDDYAADLRNRYSVVGEKKWKIWQVANEAKLKSEHVKEYFQGCKHVHSMLSALVAREQGMGYLPDAIYGFTTTVTSACVLLMVYFRLHPDVSEEALNVVREAIAAKNVESRG